MKRISRYWKQFWCDHDLKADTQLCFVICHKCLKLYWYGKPIDCQFLLKKLQENKDK